MYINYCAQKCVTLDLYYLLTVTGKKCDFLKIQFDIQYQEAQIFPFVNQLFSRLGTAEVLYVQAVLTHFIQKVTIFFF